MSSHDEQSFRAVVTIASKLGPNGTLDVDSLDDTNPIWEAPRGLAVLRNANEMAKAARLLLYCSSEILLVDQHYSGAARFGRPLAAMIQCAFVGKPITRFEYHLGAGDVTSNVFEQQLSQQRRHLEVPEGQAITFVRWRQRAEGDTLHPRYVLTERGGLRFEHGLDEGNDGETTDVECMAAELHQRRRAQFHPESGQFELVDAWIVNATSVSRASWDGSKFVST